MPSEIELKLAISPQALRTATRLPWLRNLASAKATRRRLVSTYFDTPKLALREDGFTLRIRKMGRQRMQTIKANGAAALGRSEWEELVATGEPDLDRAKHTALAPLIDGKLAKSLRPMFVTDVWRTVIPLRVGGSDVELALDRGEIRSGRQRDRISEIELELKNGERADIAHLARRLARAMPVSYGARAKSDRGYALRAGERHTAVKAAPIALDANATAGDAFMMIGLSCLQHLAVNEDAVRHAEPEGVHQMRVGLRRLRAAISLFKRIVRGGETERIKGELKWLTEQLGAARDFDVLIAESVQPLRKDTGNSELAVLETDLKQRRDDALNHAKAAVESKRYRDLVLATALWLIDGAWVSAKACAEARGQPVRDAARHILDRRAKKIVKRLKKLETLSVPERHRLRIAVKKLRYANGFFETLFTNRKARKARKRFGKALKGLQTALGQLNDMTVHDKLARQFAHPSRRAIHQPEKAFAMGLLTGREQSRARACLAAAVRARKDLADAHRFWC